MEKMKTFPLIGRYAYYEFPRLGNFFNYQFELEPVAQNHSLLIQMCALYF